MSVRVGLFLIALLTFASFARPEGRLNAADLTSAKPGLSQREVIAAVQGLAELNGFPADESLSEIIAKFYELPLATDLDQAARETLLEETKMALWVSAIDDFTGLATVLFEESGQKAQKQKDFDRFQLQLSKFKSAINAYVLTIHPGFQFLDMTQLTAAHDGKGVTIAVFDVFDSDILKQQQKRFREAKIDAPVSFGKPLSLSHGNVVIDIILQIAPRAHIVPVWADAKDYPQAMLYLQNRLDIDIVNMSRAFADSPNHKGLDPVFKKALKTLTQEKILSKALGNSGTDLLGHVTNKRLAEGLGPVNNLSSYDRKLIADTYSEGDSPDLLLFALNLSLFADDIALSATIPGDFAAIQSRSIALPAEGVWSPSTETFESGSSFAAPQLSALAALLLEKESTVGGTRIEQRERALMKLKASCDLRNHSQKDWGLGLPSADKAFAL